LFKLGSYLLFITFSQLIAVVLYLQHEFGYVIENMPFLVAIAFIIEFTFSGYLINKGYPKIDKLD
jgi:hypothetical protein